MSAQNARSSELIKWMFLTTFAIAFGAPLRCHGQVDKPEAMSRVRFAQEFLRTLYPELNGKKYILTIKTAFQYDVVQRTPNWLFVYVGAGTEFIPVSCCLGGSMSNVAVSPPQPPYPPELGHPPSPPPASAQPTPQPSNNDKIVWDSQGRGYPKQYLITHFQFADDESLAGFSAEGPAIGNSEADKELYEYVRTHPQITEQEIIAKLKQSGAKFGPGDKEQFVKNLPIKELERFMGKVEVISASFLPLQEDRGNLVEWPYWQVRACAGTDSKKLEYQFMFEHFKGELTGLRLIQAAERKSGELDPCRQQ